MPRGRPSYRLHRATGQAVVTLGGKDYYLGLYGTEESRRKYDLLLDRYLAEGKPPPREAATPHQRRLRVWQLVERFRDHVEGPGSPYRKCGRLTGRINSLRAACRHLREQSGQEYADQLGPAALKRWREDLLHRGLSGGTVNGYLTAVKVLYRWAAEEELVPGSVWHSLRAVRPARQRRIRVKPVDPHVFHLTLAGLHDVLRGAAQVQYLAAMRPCEVLGMTPYDLNLAGQLPDGTTFPGVWVYLVPEWCNKTARHGQDRVVFLGPQAQAIITPFLAGRPRDTPIFNPAEAPRMGRRIVHHYTAGTYGRRITLVTEKLQLPHWAPNQLRHLRATEIRSWYGREAARVVLGHATPGVTEDYAEADLGLAAKVMRERG